jgi:hypothetical protein
MGHGLVALPPDLTQFTAVDIVAGIWFWIKWAFRRLSLSEIHIFGVGTAFIGVPSVTVVLVRRVA